MLDDAEEQVFIGELLGEQRELPAEGEAMFVAHEIATAQTVLRGTRLMLEDRLGEEAARPLGDILRWAQTVVLSAVLEDDLPDGMLLEDLARAFAKRVGYSGSEGDGREDLPFGDAIRA